jgi:uncharacterized membrane protein YbhN (UPF0104 family)
MRLRLILRILVSIGISALLLWILFSLIQKRPGELILHDMLTIAGNLPPWTALPYIISTIGHVLFRTLRYRLLLRTGMEHTQTIPIPALFFLTLSRNMFVDMLPSRLGEASYLVLLKRVLGTRLAHGLSSLSVSFAFDLVALTSLVFFIGGIGLFFRQPSKPLLLLLGLLTVIVCIGLVLLFFGLGWILNLMESVFKNFRRYKPVQSLLCIFEETWASITHIRDNGVLLQTFLFSLCVRIFKYAGLFFLLYMILTTAFPTVALHQLDNLFFSLITGEMAASLPIPTFMGYGSYEMGAAWVLSSTGYTVSQAAIAVFLLHLFSQIINYALGFCGTLYCIFTKKKKDSSGFPEPWKI